jgi:hypothetical protein
MPRRQRPGVIVRRWHRIHGRRAVGGAATTTVDGIPVPLRPASPSAVAAASITDSPSPPRAGQDRRLARPPAPPAAEPRVRGGPGRRTHASTARAARSPGTHASEARSSRARVPVPRPVGEMMARRRMGGSGPPDRESENPRSTRRLTASPAGLTARTRGAVVAAACMQRRPIGTRGGAHRPMLARPNVPTRMIRFLDGQRRSIFSSSHCHSLPDRLPQATARGGRAAGSYRSGGATGNGRRRRALDADGRARRRAWSARPATATSRGRVYVPAGARSGQRKKR